MLGLNRKPCSSDLCLSALNCWHEANTWDLASIEDKKQRYASLQGVQSLESKSSINPKLTLTMVVKEGGLLKG